MKNISIIMSSIVFIFIFIFSQSVLALPYELISTTDSKISTNFFSVVDDSFRDAYSIVSGVERDIISDGIDRGSIYYKGFDLNLDKLFNYNEVNYYNSLTDQKYVINTLNVEVKLKDDQYSVLGLSYDDIPEERGRIDVQLWTEDTEKFGGSWPNSVYGTNEIDTGDTFTFSLDFSVDPLNYDDWYNHGEIIVTAWYPSIIANSDFIVDRVRIWGDRSLFAPPAPVPEPSTFLLLGGGLAGLALVVRRRKKE